MPKTEPFDKYIDEYDNGFCDVQIIQTVFGEMNEIKNSHIFKEGYGEGGFIVISANKSLQTNY